MLATLACAFNECDRRRLSVSASEDNIDALGRDNRLISEIERQMESIGGRKQRRRSGR